VQPCFDRKIEAARPHFQAPDAEDVQEVDTVLTAMELLELVQGTVQEEVATGPDSDFFEALPSCPADSEILTDLLLGSVASSSSGRPAPFLCAVRGGNAGAGGFVEHVFRGAASKLFQRSIDEPLTFKNRQNSDMREVTLVDPDSKQVLLRFVSAYGFRNIQNVIRRLTKEGTDPSKELGDFVEIMACPGGCLNGAGLPAPPKAVGAVPTPREKRERLENLESLLHSGEGVAVVPPLEHPLMPRLYRYIASRAEQTKPSADKMHQLELSELVGGVAVRGFLGAEWRSLKVDEEGKEVVSTSVLKW
jgi:iron only hydrogenase large subunit-like protein